MSVPEELLSRVEGFATLPDVVSRVRRTLDQPDFQMDRVARLIELDPSLSARLIQLANSPVFGGWSAIENVVDAVRRLGASETRTVVLTVGLMQNLPRLPEPCDVRKFWEHGLATAMMARRISGDVGIAKGDTAYLAGLVHNLGEAYLAVQFTRRFRRAIENTKDGEITGPLRDEFGCDPAELSAAILEGWSFPRSVVEAVRWQREPASAPQEEVLASSVMAADRLCRALGLGPIPSQENATWIDEVPDAFVEQLAQGGYPDLTFYLMELVEDLGEISGFARSVFGSDSSR